jgi:hypothetical protein
MSAATLAGLSAAALVGFGLYGLLTDPHPLRKILAFNILGSGVCPDVRHHRARERRPASPPIRAAGDGHHRHRRRLLGHGARGGVAAASFPGDRPPTRSAPMARRNTRHRSR